MPSLRDMILNDFGVEQQVKTAGVQDSAEIDALAARYGFNFSKVASDDKDADDKEKGKEKGKEKEKEEGSEKESSIGLDAYYNSLFPEDGMLSKTAEEMEKIAFEENLGARAYDHFAARWDRRLEKIASQLLSVSAPTGADHDGNVHKEDPTIPQANETNRKHTGEKIDTTPSYTDEIHSGNDERQLGHVQQKHAAVAELAMRKAFILSQLEG